MGKAIFALKNTIKQKNHTFKERKDDDAEEGSIPSNPISYAMFPSALNIPKFLSEVGPGFEFSLNMAKT